MNVLDVLQHEPMHDAPVSVACNALIVEWWDAHSHCSGRFRLGAPISRQILRNCGH